MNTTRKQNVSPPACAAAIIGVQRAKHQTSRFEELANLPLKENRRTKETAPPLRDKLRAPAIIAAAIGLPTGDAGLSLWALPLINALGETRDEQLISEIQGGVRPSRSTNTRPGLVVNGVPLLA